MKVAAAWRAQNRAKGNCWFCRTKAEPGKTRCAAHAAYQSAWKKNGEFWRHWVPGKEDGRC